jgi:hypothetical protein
MWAESEDSPLIEAVMKEDLVKTKAKQPLVNPWVTENSSVRNEEL